MKIKKIVIFGVAIVLLGVFLPRIISGSGVRGYYGEEEVFARFAMKQTELALGGSLEPLLIPGMYVASIKQLSPERVSCAYEPFLVEHKYEATVRLVSWFGIPYGKIEIDCEGASSVERF